MTAQSFITKEIKILVYNNNQSISVIASKGISLIGSADCSLIKDNVWYFNRLFIHPLFRGNSYASILLDKLLSIIKERNLVLKLDINPYGDMSYEQLEKFYIRHGFVKTMQKDDKLGYFPVYYYNNSIGKDKNYEKSKDN